MLNQLLLFVAVYNTRSKTSQRNVLSFIYLFFSPKAGPSYRCLSKMLAQGLSEMLRWSLGLLSTMLAVHLSEADYT